uniref:MULE transposase domain-containing protein n=1 Tax=Panagrolaimus sp. ES5 TaxID=591445 RepID=A0AC34GG89_9BILA
MLNKKVKEKEEDGDHDGVMSRIGTTESVRRALKASSKIIRELFFESHKSSFSDGADIVRMNDEDFLFLMEDKGIEILRKAKYWKFDGTYEKCPPEFEQVYTIVAVFADYPERQKSFTAGIVFVKEKDTASYARLFTKLKALVGADVGPKEFGFDHELAAINGAKTIFPEATIIYFWHYPRNLREYARSKKCSHQLLLQPFMTAFLDYYRKQ